MHKTSIAVASRTVVGLSLVSALFVAIRETSTLELGLFLGGHVGVSGTLLRVGILSLNAVCVSALFVVPATWLFRVVDRRVAAPEATAMAQSSGFRWFIFATGSVCLPFAEYMGYVYLSHWPHEWFSGASDLAAFTLAILTSFVLCVAHSHQVVLAAGRVRSCRADSWLRIDYLLVVRSVHDVSGVPVSANHRTGRRVPLIGGCWCSARCRLTMRCSRPNKLLTSFACAKLVPVCSAAELGR